MALSWKPVRNGNNYCAPACGGRCTLVAYKAAVKKAALLAREIGPGWKPRVWENLGWHYSATFGTSSVHPCSSDMYWASIYIGRQFMANDKNPRKAFLKALAEGKKALDSWNEDYEAIAQSKKNK